LIKQILTCQVSLERPKKSHSIVNYGAIHIYRRRGLHNQEGQRAQKVTQNSKLC
jgi:hypothetical protein